MKKLQITNNLTTKAFILYGKDNSLIVADIIVYRCCLDAIELSYILQIATTCDGDSVRLHNIVNVNGFVNKYMLQGADEIIETINNNQALKEKVLKLLK